MKKFEKNSSVDKIFTVEEDWTCDEKNAKTVNTKFQILKWLLIVIFVIFLGICAFMAWNIYDLLSELSASEKVPTALEQKNHRILEREVSNRDNVPEDQKNFALVPDLSKLRESLMQKMANLQEVEKEEEVKKKVHTFFENVPIFFKLIGSFNNQSTDEGRSAASPSQFPNLNLFGASFPEHFSIIGGGFFNDPASDATTNRRKRAIRDEKKCRLTFTLDMNWMVIFDANFGRIFVPVNFVPVTTNSIQVRENDELKSWLAEHRKSSANSGISNSNRLTEQMECLQKMFYDPNFRVDCSRKVVQILCVETKEKVVPDDV